MKLTIPSFQLDNWRYGGTTGRLRIYPNDTFKTSDGQIIIQGSIAKGAWYKEINCTISGSTLTIPQFVIDSTTDSDNPNATYSAVFFDARGVRRDNFFPDMPEFRVSHSGGSASNWLQIREYNQNASRSAPPNWYETVNQLFNSTNSKLGAGASSPNVGQILYGTGAGSSIWTSQPTLEKIFLKTGGYAAPLAADGAGSRFIFYDGGGVNHYSTGIEAGALWQNVPADSRYKFYFGANPANAYSLGSNNLNFKTENAIFIVDAQIGIASAGGLRLSTNGDFFQFGTNNNIDWELFKGNLRPKVDNAFDIGSNGMRVRNVFAGKFSVSSGASSAEILSGIGSPNGVVTAGIGSVYLRLDGGVSTSFYVKESGAGNTGWAAFGAGGGSGGVAGVSDINGRTGAVTLSASDVGLSNVPNVNATSRANHTGIQSPSTISISPYRILGRGAGNSDPSKPNTAEPLALGGGFAVLNGILTYELPSNLEVLSNKGALEGYTPLVDGKVPTVYLPDPQPGGTSNTTVTGGNLVATSGYASLEAAFAAIGAAPTTLMVNSVVPLTVSTTPPATLAQPANILLYFVGGGRVSKTTATTFTALNFTCDDQYQKCFSGFTAGDLKFGLKIPSKVSPCWFGAEIFDVNQGNTGLDTLPAITLLTGAFVTADRDGRLRGTAICFPNGDFYFSGRWKVQKSFAVIGTESNAFWAHATRFHFPTGCNGIELVPDTYIGAQMERPVGNILRNFEVRAAPSFYLDTVVNVRNGTELQYVSGADFSKPFNDGDTVQLGNMCVIARKRKRGFLITTSTTNSITVDAEAGAFTATDLGADVTLPEKNWVGKITVVTSGTQIQVSPAIPAQYVAATGVQMYLSSARIMDFDKIDVVFNVRKSTQAERDAGAMTLDCPASRVNLDASMVGRTIKFYKPSNPSIIHTSLISAINGKALTMATPLPADWIPSFLNSDYGLGIIQSLADQTNFSVRCNRFAGISIELGGNVHIDSVMAYKFAGDGFRIDTDQYQTGQYPTANMVHLSNIVAELNESHGFHSNGADSNAILIVNPNFINNNGYCYYDDSYLGTTVIAGHMTDGVSGSVYTKQNSTNNTQFFGTYFEGAEPPIKGGRGFINVGGSNGIGYHPDSQHSAGFDTGHQSNALGISGGGLVFGNKAKTMSVRLKGGGGLDDANFFLSGGGASLESFNNLGDWGMAYGDLFNYVYFGDKYSGGSNGWTLAVDVAAKAALARKLRIGDGSQNTANFTEMISGTAVPSGSYPKGAVVWNRTPTSGGTVGWINIGDATTANWQTFGTIGTGGATPTPTPTPTPGTVGTLVSRFNFGVAAVSGWTSVAAGSGGFVGFDGGFDYTDTVDVNTQTGAVDTAVYKTLLYKSTSGSGAASFTIPSLTAGTNYIARVHVWMPAGFEPSASHSWNIDVNGGTAKPVTTQPNQLRIVDIPFTGASANVLNFSANTGGQYKVANGLEIYNAA